MQREKRRQAVQLRKQGKSYSEIIRATKVAKSTLSLWLRNYPLSETQIEKLGSRYKFKQIEKFRESMRIKKS